MSGNFNYRGEIARERVEASERCRGGAIGARLNLRTTLVRNFDSRYIGGGEGGPDGLYVSLPCVQIDRTARMASLSPSPRIPGYAPILE